MTSVTSAQMRRIDAASIKHLNIPVLLLMDNAGRCVAETARALLHKRGGKKVIVLCGGGANGGDGVAAARYLKGWGCLVNVIWLKNPARWTGDMAAHFRIAKRCGVPFFSFEKIQPAKRVHSLRDCDLLIDALLGIGAHGSVRIPMFDAIAAMNASRRPIVAVDVPSGLDADTGRVQDIAVKARVTVTMAAPKQGLLLRRARRYVGRLVIADIGIPRSAFRSY